MDFKFREGGGADGVAIGQDRGSFASSLNGGWALVPPASGAACAKALRRAGLDVRLDGPDHVAVKLMGVTVVRIPLAVERLRPELLVAILRTVGVTPVKFTECLDP